MYVESQQGLGFWGIGRKVKKAVKKYGKVAAAIYPGAALVVPTKETAKGAAIGLAVGGTAAGAAAALPAVGAASGTAAAGTPSLLDKAQSYLNDPKLKSTLDAARSLLQKPKAPPVDSAPADTPDFLNLRNANPLILGMVGIGAVVALTMLQSKRK